VYETESVFTNDEPRVPFEVAVKITASSTESVARMYAEPFLKSVSASETESAVPDDTVFEDVDAKMFIAVVVTLEATVKPSPGRRVVATPAASLIVALRIAPSPPVAGEPDTLDKVTLAGVPAVVIVMIADLSPETNEVLATPLETIIW